MSAPNDVIKSGSPSKAWLASCAAVCLAILAYGVLGEKEAPGNISYQLGYNLPWAIFIGGGLHLVFRRREPARTGWLGLLAIYAALIAASHLSANRQREELKTAAAEIERTVTTAAQATVASTPSVPSPLPTAPVAGGEAGKIETVIKTMMNKTLAQRREYELELEAIGWSNILDGERIRKDSTLAESNTMIRQAHDIVAKYSARTDDLFIQIRRDIETSGMKPDSQREMLAGFDETASRSKAQASKVWALEEQVLSQVENVFTLLAAKRNAWQVQQNQILFNNQGDLDLFKSYLSRINQIVAQQQEMQNVNMRRTQESLKQLSK